MINLDELNHRELRDLSLDVTRRLKEFSVVRLRTRAKRCGKKGCFCADGPADGSWGNFHGPYILAQYVDNDTQKMRLVSLGRHYEADDIIEAREKILDRWFDFFTITPPEAEKLGDNFWWGHRYINLSAERFRDFYGLDIEDDRLDRHMRYYATKEKYQAYEAHQRANDEKRLALSDDLAVIHGIGSVTGQKKLRQLLRGKYYLVV